MDTRLHYQSIVHEVLTHYHEVTAHTLPGVHRQLVLDRDRDHYLLMMVGWQGTQRVDGCVIHIDIVDGQVWIQHDGTEYGIANALVERGIPPTDIVLGFHAPYKRPYTGFGVGRESASQAA